MTASERIREARSLTSGVRVRTDFGYGVVVEGMPHYPGFVYVSLVNPFSDAGKRQVVPVPVESVHGAA